MKKILSLLIVLAGVALLLFSNYIKTQVEEGNLEILGAEKKLEQGTGFFSLNPLTQQFGKGLTSGARKKIAKGKEDVAYYTQLANNLQMGGIALIVVGAAMFLYFSTRKTVEKKK